jgi:hypothetical protein
MRGGKRPGAGRKPGSRTLLTIAIKQSLAATAKEHAPEAMGAIVAILRDGRLAPAARLDAAKLILHYGYGKPVAAVEVSGPGGRPIETREVSDIKAVRQMIFVLNKAVRDAASGR